MSLILAEVKQ